MTEAKKKDWREIFRPLLSDWVWRLIKLGNIRGAEKRNGGFVIFVSPVRCNGRAYPTLKGLAV